MQEKAWASLAPLLDSRRYIESISVGLLLKAHKDFRFVATMNDDSSCCDLPEYIQSRLHPYIGLDFPDRSEERKILEVNLPHTDPTVLDYVADFLEVARREGEDSFQPVVAASAPLWLASASRGIEDCRHLGLIDRMSCRRSNVNQVFPHDNIEMIQTAR